MKTKNDKTPKGSLRETVYVAMSGGVDSSVAAALLCKNKNYDVVGVFFKPWIPSEDVSYCNWREDREMAMRVCAKLGIKFKTWDFSKDYGEKVVSYMVNSYQQGLTPNPDVMCNKEIKFGLFLKKALAEGTDFIATGHYVKMKGDKLMKGIDGNKDQSYFLWTLTQKQLKHCLFPVGDYTKPEVRKLAKKFGLPNYNKKDSQGVCFVGQLDVKSFLKEYIKSKEGDIVLMETKEIIGRHDGAYYYTIGQRHGMNISNGGGPYFICGKDINKNIIYVTKKLDGELVGKEMLVEKISWTGVEPKLPMKAQVKIRYRNQSFPAVIEKNADKKNLLIRFSKPVKAITPGQSAVFYRGEEVLGGGVIL
jgi:tRNA-specific 2-thiouridylase